jgi:hypothetical protein
MGSRPLTFTVGRPIPTEQAAPSTANVVQFKKRGRPRAKFESVTSTRSSKAVMPPSSTTAEGGTSGSYESKRVIIDFAHTGRDGHTTKGRKGRSNESETGLTLADYAAMTYVVMSAAFYPALAFLFLP